MGVIPGSDLPGVILTNCLVLFFIIVKCIGDIVKHGRKLSVKVLLVIMLFSFAVTASTDARLFASEREKPSIMLLNNLSADTKGDEDAATVSMAQLVDAAAAAVKKAEEDLSEESIAHAQTLIDELPEGRDKDKLQENLDIVYDVHLAYLEMSESGDARNKMIANAVLLIVGGLVIVIALTGSSLKEKKKS